MEILDLYDNKKRKINRTIIRDKENTQKGEYKLSTHVWIMNSKGEFVSSINIYKDLLFKLIDDKKADM